MISITDVGFAHLYKIHPTIAPTASPTTTASGTEVAGAEKVTPATKTIASMPSLSTVTKGSTNMAYFSKNLFRVLPMENFPVLMGASMAAASLTRHFSCIFPIRSKANPTAVMMVDAIKQNAPS